MILLQEEEDQRPKLPTDPVTTSTTREREIYRPEEALERPSSPHPTLPDYETSEAQYSLFLSFRKKSFKSPRLWKLLWYAIVLYSALFIVAGVPYLATQRGRQRWQTSDSFIDYVPPPAPQTPHTDTAVLASVASSCNQWTGHESHSESVGGGGSASTTIELPTHRSIVLRSNSTINHWTNRVLGHLNVDLNPEPQVTSTILSITVNYTHRDLFERSLVCQTTSYESFGLFINLPDDWQDVGLLDFYMKLLIPQASAPLHIQEFSTVLPFFEHNFGVLSPNVTFGTVSIESSAAKVTFGYIEATSLLAKTSEAEISGNFNGSDALSLDTINGPIYANISMVNFERRRKTSTLTLETGNAPIGVNLSLSVNERSFFRTPDHPNFLAKVRTFNAPVDIFVGESSQLPSRMVLRTQSTQGPVNVTLDSTYMGTFDLQAKSSSTSVQERPFFGASWSEGYEDVAREINYDYVSSDRVLGWVGWGRRPTGHARHRQSHVEIVSSLSPVVLRLDTPAPLTTVRRR